MSTTPDNASEQAKEEDQARELLVQTRTEEAQSLPPTTRWELLQEAEVHALLYIGDQVRALVEAFTHPAPAVAGMEAVSPDILDNPIRALLIRYRERLDGHHRQLWDGKTGACECDSACRAITEALR